MPLLLKVLSNRHWNILLIFILLMGLRRLPSEIALKKNIALVFLNHDTEVTWLLRDEGIKNQPRIVWLLAREERSLGGFKPSVMSILQRSPEWSINMISHELRGQLDTSTDIKIDNAQLMLEIDSESPVALQTMASALNEAGMWKDALPYWQQGIKLKPNDAAMHLGLAQAFQKTNQVGNARQAYIEAINLAPDWTKVRFEYIVFLEIYGSPEEYKEQLLISVNQWPENSFFLLPYGRLLINEGSFKKAEQVLLKAQEYAPNWGGVVFELGNIYNKQGDFIKAAQYYFQANKLAPRNELFEEYYSEILNRLCLIQNDELIYYDAVRLLSELGHECVTR